MKLLKRVFIWVIVILFILVLNAFFYLSGLEPTYEGNLSIPSLSEEVNVHYDQYGIPHIYAQNNADAYRALGYVHAQDRLWQMELMRRIAPGRLSEMFGKDLLETDKFFKTLGLHRTAKKEAEAFMQRNNPEKELVLAYLEGVNQFITDGPDPVEFLLLGLDKEPYKVEDIYNVMGYIAFSFAQAQKIDPIATQIYNKLGPEYFFELDVQETGQSEAIRNYPRNASLDSLVAKTDRILESLPVPAWLGSNSWVVNPQKSASGNVMLANDPHMGFSQPCVWYEAHVVTPDYERYGYHAALMPFALLLHTRQHAIGLTMLENDDVDFFYDVEVDESFEETIQIKDEDPVTIQVRTSDKGPIVNDVVNHLDDKPIALWWTYLQLEMESMQALYRLNHGKNMDDVREGAAKIKAPGLNVMYGDADGNIAWWASAKLHLMDSSLNRNLVLDGNDSTTNAIEWLEFSENPQSENPPWNYVYSTNNQPDSIKGGFYPGYYTPDDRGRRITELLESKDKISVEDYQQFFLDNKGVLSLEIAQELAKAVSPETDLEKQAVEILVNWDGHHTKDAKAPVVYEKLIYHTMRLIMENKLDSGQFDGFVNTHLMKRSYLGIVKNENSVWWDDLTTNEKETREMMISKALRITVNELEEQMGGVNKWKWGKVHTLEHPHPIGVGVSLLRSFFNVGVFEMDAADGNLNKLSYLKSASGEYPIVSGPSTRRIVNFGDLDNSLSILPTGQSGNPLSDHYNDQADLYIKGKWRKMLMNKEEIESKKKGTLVLKKE